jgi:ATP-dependent helicase/nuclease subunit A
MREADALARLAARTVFDRPLVLEAGAGTGKTATLVARVIAWCVGEGWDQAADELQTSPSDAAGSERIARCVVEGVVAITFTEAAAAEMAARVARAFDSLGHGLEVVGIDRAALSPEVGERSRALLVGLDRLEISTIHAFCRRILARHPIEAGMVPGFVVDADEEVLRRAVAEVVRRALEDEGAQVKTSLEGSAGTDGTGTGPAVSPAPVSSPFAGLAARDCWPGAVAQAVRVMAQAGVSPDDLAFDPWDRKAVESLVDEVQAAAASLVRIAGNPRPGPKAALAGRIVDALERLGGVGRGAATSSVTDLRRLLDVALPPNLRDRIVRWAKGELITAEDEAWSGRLAEFAAAAGRLSSVLTTVSEIDTGLLDIARPLVQRLLAETSRQMRAEGAVTFQALLRETRRLLEAYPWVVGRERAHIRQLLVDEFQDTDAEQCGIVKLLALDEGVAPRPGLFLVGDPKQSIYGWRNADLGAYERMCDAVIAANGEIHRLVVNFRSAPPILAEVARCIRPVMRQQAGLQPAFQELLACEERVWETGFTQDRWAPVEHWVSGADGAPARELAEREAAAVAADIVALHTEAGVAFEEVALLLRTTSDLPAYLTALREAGVPYRVERDRSFYQRREVIDAAALVRTVLDPSDHLALVTWLRSCVVGVPDIALAPLLGGGLAEAAAKIADRTAAADPSLVALVERTLAGLPALTELSAVRGFGRSLLAGLGILGELRESWARDSAAEFVERLRSASLIEALEAARVLGAYRLANLERFFLRLGAVLERDRASREAVLTWLRRVVRERPPSQEALPLRSTRGAVRVLTIHRAKGLDFGHVYLLQAHKTVRRDGGALTSAEVVGDGVAYRLLGVPSPGWRAVESRRAAVTRAERVRTLYVALTRAKVRLVAVGSWSAEPTREVGSHLELLRDREGGAVDTAAIPPGGFVDAAGARWVRPEPGSVPAIELPAAAIPTREEIAADARRVAEARSHARGRMCFPLTAPVSGEAHTASPVAADAASLHSTGGPEVARIVGVVVHRVLEKLDLGADVRTGLGEAKHNLTNTIAVFAPAGQTELAGTRAAAVLDRLLAGTLLDRLAELAGHVLGREVPVLLLGTPGSPTALIGTIDLLAQDPATGGLVIVDYKTDDVDDAQLADRADVYAPQVRAYVRAVAEALSPSQPPRGELWFVLSDRRVPVD